MAPAPAPASVWRWCSTATAAPTPALPAGGGPAIPAGLGSATITVDGSNPCGFASAFVAPEALGGRLPAGYAVAQSAFQFSSTDCGSGAVARLSVSYAQAVPAGTVLYKYGPATPGRPSRAGSR
jgi:hypothetical protein